MFLFGFVSHLACINCMSHVCLFWFCRLSINLRASLWLLLLDADDGVGGQWVDKMDGALTILWSAPSGRRSDSGWPSGSRAASAECC